MSDPAAPEEHAPQAQTGAPASTERRMPTSQPILLRALRWGLLATAALVIVFAGVGWLVSDSRGLVGGIIGAGMAGIFLAMTVGSIAFANRFVESDFYVVAFFSIVLGSWFVKFIAFIVAAVLLRGQPWLDPTILFLGIIAGVLVSLVIDVLVVSKSRLPYVSDPR